MEELIVVRQLPVIEERMLAAKARVEKRVADAKVLVCTEDTMQSVKAIRAELNKERHEAERQYREARDKVLAPVRQVDAIFKECVSEVYESADSYLKQEINNIERAMKKRCEDGLREYFDELCQAHRIDFLRYEQAGISVDMASAKAKTPKKLREQLVQFVASVSQSVELISGMDDADEIMIEYKHSLNLGNAVAIVQERHRRLEAERAAAARREEEKARQAEAVHRVQKCFTPPVAAPAAPKIASVTFTVTDTIDRLKLLKQFLVSNGYEFK